MPVASVDGKAFGLGPEAHELQQELRRRATRDLRTGSA
jgi:hypothetical protein